VLIKAANGKPSIKPLPRKESQFMPHNLNTPSSPLWFKKWTLLLVSYIFFFSISIKYILKMNLLLLVSNRDLQFCVICFQSYLYNVLWDSLHLQLIKKQSHTFFKLKLMNAKTGLCATCNTNNYIRSCFCIMLFY